MPPLNGWEWADGCWQSARLNNRSTWHSRVGLGVMERSWAFSRRCFDRKLVSTCSPPRKLSVWYPPSNYAPRQFGRIFDVKKLGQSWEWIHAVIINTSAVGMFNKTRGCGSDKKIKLSTLPLCDCSHDEPLIIAVGYSAWAVFALAPPS